VLRLLITTYRIWLQAKTRKFHESFLKLHLARAIQNKVLSAWAGASYFILRIALATMLQLILERLEDILVCKLIANNGDP